MNKIEPPNADRSNKIFHVIPTSQFENIQNQLKTFAEMKKDNLSLPEN